MRRLVFLLVAFLAPQFLYAQPGPSVKTIMSSQTVLGTADSATVNITQAKTSRHFLLVRVTDYQGVVTSCSVELMQKVGTASFASTSPQSLVACALGGDNAVILSAAQFFADSVLARVTVGGGGSAVFTITYIGYFAEPQLLGLASQGVGSDNLTLTSQLCDGSGICSPLQVEPYGFDGSTWDKLRTVAAGRSNSPFPLQVSPYLSDDLTGTNADAMESGFLIQQQGTGAQNTNDGSGIPAAILMGYDRNGQTFHLANSTVNSGLVVTEPIQNESDTLGRSFQVSNVTTTAVDNTNVTAQTTRDLYFRDAFVSCLAACVVNINLVTTAGTTCTTTAPAPLIVSSGTSDAVSTTNCTTDPTVVANSAIRVDLPATQNTRVDLMGIVTKTSGDGVNCVSATATTVSCTLRWYEK